MEILIKLIFLSRWFAASALLLALSAPAPCAEDQFFDSAGVQIRYRTEGAGDPVVLIHGGMSRLEDMGPLSNTLVDRYQVVRLDLRGHGKSGKPHDPGRYGAEMAADVVRLLDHLKIARAHVAGSSLGAAVAAKILETRPERLLTATLIGGAGGRESDLRITDALAGAIERGEGFGLLIKALTPPGQPPPTEERIQKESAYISATNDLQALVAYMRGSRGLIVDYQRMAAGKVPTHAVIGELDPFKPGVDALAQAMPALKVTVLAGRGHNYYGAPGFISAVRDFLATHRVP